MFIFFRIVLYCVLLGSTLCTARTSTNLNLQKPKHPRKLVESRILKILPPPTKLKVKEINRANSKEVNSIFDDNSLQKRKRKINEIIKKLTEDDIVRLPITFISNGGPLSKESKENTVETYVTPIEIDPSAGEQSTVPLHRENESETEIPTPVTYPTLHTNNQTNDHLNDKSSKIPESLSLFPTEANILEELKPVNPPNDDLENPGNFSVKIPEIMEEKMTESSLGISTSAQPPPDDEIDPDINVVETQIIKDIHTTPKPGIVSQYPVFGYPSSTNDYWPGTIGYDPNSIEGYDPNSIEGYNPNKYGYKPFHGGQTPIFWNVQYPLQFPSYMYFQFPIRSFYYIP